MALLPGCWKRPPYLRAALRSPDAEIRERCGRILAIFADAPIACTPKARQRALAFAKAGQIELAIEQLVAVDPTPNDEQYWQCVFDVGRLVRDKALEYYHEEFDAPFPSWRGTSTPAELFEKWKVTKKESISTRGAIKKASLNGCVRAGRIDVTLVLGGIAVSSQLNPAYAGGVLLTQDLWRAPGLNDGVLVARDTLRARNDEWVVRNTIVICRGEMPKVTWVENSIIVSSSRVGVSRGTLRRGKWVIKENEPKPLGFIQWFETAQIGIEASDDGGVLHISRLDEGKAFARAGCKVGDQIWSVKDKHFDTPEEFRLALRRAVIDGTASLTIVRDKKSIDLDVAIERE